MLPDWVMARSAISALGVAWKRRGAARKKLGDWYMNAPVALSLCFGLDREGNFNFFFYIY
jgi:hypothetical protein